MTDVALRLLRKLAMANRLANARLHAACHGLTQHQYVAPRAAFFGSIRSTLNHILLVDRFYIGALTGHGYDSAALDAAENCEDLATLASWQADSDTVLIRHLADLTGAALAEVVAVDRLTSVQYDRRDDLLSHLFQHQTHHRGQVHGMLSDTPVAPPQLDEFITSGDAPFRAKDMARLGWSESRLMDPTTA